MGKKRGKHHRRSAVGPVQTSVRATAEAPTSSEQAVNPPSNARVVDELALANLGLTKWMVRWTAVLAVVGVATVIVGAVTAGVAYVQWEALLKTDRTTREAFTSVQRPFIIANGLSAVQDLPAYWSFQTVLENTGSTPTKNLTVTSAVSFSAPVLPDSPNDPGELKKLSSEAYPTVTDHFIGPRGKGAVDALSLITKTLEEMADKRADFFVYGIARYNDQFSETTERITKFCYVVRPYKRQGDLTLQNRAPCHHWNCGDEDCDRDKRKYEEERAEFLRKNPNAREVVRDIPIAAIVPFYPIPLVKAQ